MTARSLNKSRGFIAAQADQLELVPFCECGAPAREAHRAGGCAGNPPYAELVSLCRPCHDATACTTPPRPSLLFNYLFGH